VPDEQTEAELTFLQTEVFGRDDDVPLRRIDGLQPVFCPRLKLDLFEISRI
jgi:hypothetical protein